MIFALADALTLPTLQVNYARVAHLLEMSRPELIAKMLHYGIPCPALARKLTAAERDRIPRLKCADAERYDEFAVAIATFIREVFGGS
jgi:hypothetical protein